MQSVYSKQQVQHGFSLIEGIVALFILSVVAASTLQWVSQVSETAIRLQRHSENQTLDNSLIELAKVVNPSMYPVGTIQLNSLSVSWSSSQVNSLDKFVDAVNEIRQPLYLYEVTFLVVDSNDAPIRQYTTLIPGYKKEPVIL